MGHDLLNISSHDNISSANNIIMGSHPWGPHINLSAMLTIVVQVICNFVTRIDAVGLMTMPCACTYHNTRSIEYSDTAMDAALEHMTL